jgi:hypothetical protein
MPDALSVDAGFSLKDIRRLNPSLKRLIVEELSA